MNTSVRPLWSLVVVCAALAGVQRGQAQVINLYGDLGTNAWTGIGVSPPSSTFTQPFSQSAANGTITGDVIVANDPTGTIFDLTITNLTYNCTTANAAGNGDVIVQVLHSYIMGGPGPFTGSQSLAGNWTSGPNSLVQLDSIQDFGGSNINLPTLLATTSPFSLGPVSSLVFSASGSYQILATLRLETDGTGAINLPSSAHIHVDLAPSPGTCGLLGLAGLVAARRRRG